MPHGVLWLLPVTPPTFCRGPDILVFYLTSLTTTYPRLPTIRYIKEEMTS